MPLRNSVHRRNHKERSQLAHRAKLGILEKHSDYVKRARDYHSKQDKLNRLRQKAAERNKDEFYFSMIKEKTQGGVHVKDRGNAALPIDFAKILKTQDENYVRTMRAANLKKIDKLKARLTALANLLSPGDSPDGLTESEIETLTESGIISQALRGHKRASKHIVFAQDNEEALNLKAQSNQQEKRGVEMQEDDSGDLDEDVGDAGKSQSDRRRLLKELAARLVRDRQLRYAEREFEMQRLLMGKGTRQKLHGPEDANADEEDEDELDARKGRSRRRTKYADEKTYKPRVYKWKLERKR